MAALVGLQQMPGVDVRIALGSGEARVAQKLLDRPEIRASLEEVCGEAMAQRMGTHASLERDSPDPSREYSADRTICQSTARTIREQRHDRIISVYRQISGTEVYVQRASRLDTKRDYTLFSALTQNADHPPF